MTDEQEQRTINYRGYTLTRIDLPTAKSPGLWDARHTDTAEADSWAPAELTCTLADRVVHLEDALVSKELDMEIEVLRNTHMPDFPSDGTSRGEGDHDTGEEGAEHQIPESGDFRRNSASEPDQKITPLDELPDGYGYVEWERCDEESSKIHITGPRTFGGSTLCGQLIGPIAFGVMHSSDRHRVCRQCLRSLRKRQHG